MACGAPFVTEFVMDLLFCVTVVTVVTQASGALFWTEFVMGLLFCVDVIVNFNTAYFDQERERWIISRSMIAAHYLRALPRLDPAAAGLRGPHHPPGHPPVTRSSRDRDPRSQAAGSGSISQRPSPSS